MGKTELKAFQSDMAVEKHYAAATQSLALNAIVFLYKQVLIPPLPRIWRRILPTVHHNRRNHRLGGVDKRDHKPSFWINWEALEISPDSQRKPAGTEHHPSWRLQQQRHLGYTRSMVEPLKRGFRAWRLGLGESISPMERKPRPRDETHILSATK